MSRKIIQNSLAILVLFSGLATAQDGGMCDSKTKDVFSQEIKRTTTQNLSELQKLKFSTANEQVELYSDNLRMNEIIKDSNDCEVLKKKVSIYIKKNIELTEILKNATKGLISKSTCYGQVACDLYYNYLLTDNGDELVFGNKYYEDFLVFNLISYVKYRQSASEEKSSNSDQKTLMEVEKQISNNIDLNNKVISLLKEAKDYLPNSYYYKNTNLAQIRVNLYIQLSEILKGVKVNKRESAIFKNVIEVLKFQSVKTKILLKTLEQLNTKSDCETNECSYNMIKKAEINGKSIITSEYYNKLYENKNTSLKKLLTIQEDIDNLNNPSKE